MLGSLKNMAKNAAKLNSNKILKTVFDNKLLQAQILDLNTQDQMYERGVDAQGDLLGEYSAYSKLYKNFIAGGLGNDTRSDHKTYKDTGFFYRSFRFKNFKDGFYIKADSIKEGGVDLLDKEPYLIGLDEKSMDYVKDEIKPDIIGLVRKQLRK